MVLPNLKPNLIKIRLEMRSIQCPHCLKSLAMTTEKKWFDVKSRAKKAVSLYNAALKKTGGGQIDVAVPTEMQYRIAACIGDVNLSGIPGTELCDTGLMPSDISPPGSPPLAVSSILMGINSNQDVSSPLLSELMPPQPPQFNSNVSRELLPASQISAPVRHTRSPPTSEEPPRKRGKTFKIHY